MKYTAVDALSILRPDAEWTALGDVYSGIEWLDSGQTKPTETEINNKISELNSAEAMRLLREERNVLLSETDWVTVRSIDTGVAISNDWKTYRQALRDVPTQSDPFNISWPTEPS